MSSDNHPFIKKGENTHVFTRLYTLSPLWEYGDQMGEILRQLPFTVIAGPDTGFVKSNAFKGSDYGELDSSSFSSLCRGLKQGDIETFEIYSGSNRMDHDNAFSFIFRIRDEQYQAVYYKYKTYVSYKKDHIDPGNGYCIELALSYDRFTSGFSLQDFVTICETMFTVSHSIYGYMTSGHSGDFFCGISRLEDTLKLYRCLDKTVRIKEYSHRLAGIFEVNFLGKELSTHFHGYKQENKRITMKSLSGKSLMISVPVDIMEHEFPREGNPPGEGMAEGRIPGMIEGIIPSIIPELRALLPGKTAAPAPLSQPHTTAWLFSHEQVMRLGGYDFIEKFFPACEIINLEPAGIVVTKKMTNQFDDYTLMHFFQPLRPGLCSPGSIILPDWKAAHFYLPRKMTDLLSFVQIVIPENNPGYGEKLPVYVECSLSPGGNPLDIMQAIMAEWSNRTEAVVTDVLIKRRVYTAQLIKQNMDVKILLLLIAFLHEKSMTHGFSFILFIGQFHDENIRLARGFLKKQGYFINL